MTGINDVLLDRMLDDTALNRFKWTVLEKLRTYKMVRWFWDNLKTKLKERQAAVTSSEESVNETETGSIAAFKTVTASEVAAPTKLLRETRLLDISQIETEAPNDEQAAVDGIDALRSRFADAYVSIKNQEEFDLWRKRILLEEYHPLTVKNINDMVRLATQKGVRFIFVQYPLRKADDLKRILEKKDTPVIDNYSVFAENLMQYKYEAIFSDRFAYDFGHATAFGNKILAENIAKEFLK